MKFHDTFIWQKLEITNMLKDSLCQPLTLNYNIYKMYIIIDGGICLSHETTFICAWILVQVWVKLDGRPVVTHAANLSFLIKLSKRRARTETTWYWCQHRKCQNKGEDRLKLLVLISKLFFSKTGSQLVRLKHCLPTYFTNSWGRERKKYSCFYKCEISTIYIH